MLELKKVCEDSAEVRRDKFIASVQKQEFGKSLVLKKRIKDMVTVADGSVCVNVHKCSDAQKEYLIRTASALGYTPFWFSDYYAPEW